jgi:hypothetical protein
MENVGAGMIPWATRILSPLRPTDTRDGKSQCRIDSDREPYQHVVEEDDLAHS